MSALLLGGDVCEYRCPGSGETGNALEEGVQETREGTRENVRQGAEERDHQPAADDYQDRLTTQQGYSSAGAEAPGEPTDTETYHQ